jgi:hypothetical protein
MFRVLYISYLVLRIIPRLLSVCHSCLLQILYSSASSCSEFSAERVIISLAILLRQWNALPENDRTSWCARAKAANALRRAEAATPASVSRQGGREGEEGPRTCQKRRREDFQHLDVRLPKTIWGLGRMTTQDEHGHALPGAISAKSFDDARRRGLYRSHAPYHMKQLCRPKAVPPANEASMDQQIAAGYTYACGSVCTSTTKACHLVRVHTAFQQGIALAFTKDELQSGTSCFFLEGARESDADRIRRFFLIGKQYFNPKLSIMIECWPGKLVDDGQFDLKADEYSELPSHLCLSHTLHGMARFFLRIQQRRLLCQTRRRRARERR